MNQVELAPNDQPTVYVKDSFQNRYGQGKAILGGDTYEAKEAIKSLDWDETHRTWDDERDAWTIDYSSLEALDKVLDEHDMNLGGVSAEVLDVARTINDSDEDMWVNRGVEVTVEYETSQGNMQSKTGVIAGANSKEGWVNIKREDGGVNRLNGNAILAPSSHYPFMGVIQRIVVEADN